MTNVSSRNIFSYPVIGGEHLYDIYPKLNQMFELDINKEDFIDTIAEVGLEGVPTLTALDNNGVPVYLFINKDFVEEDPIKEDGEMPCNLLGFDSVFINFQDELDIFKGIPLDTPILYSYYTAPFLRSVSSLLANYGYGAFKVIDSIGPQLSGMEIGYYGPGNEFNTDSTILLNSPLMVHLRIGYKNLYLKVG